MRLTDAQRELLEDKFVLWDRASCEGNMELRDYNRRAADALKVALSLASEAAQSPLNLAWRAVDACGGTYSAAEIASGYAEGHKAALTAACEAIEKFGGRRS